MSDGSHLAGSSLGVCCSALKAFGTGTAPVDLVSETVGWAEGASFASEAEPPMSSRPISLKNFSWFSMSREMARVSLMISFDIATNFSTAGSDGSSCGTPQQAMEICRGADLTSVRHIILRGWEALTALLICFYGISLMLISQDSSFLLSFLLSLGTVAKRAKG